jgi:riboflavin kinase/FMN adenylyltransferase
MIATMLFNIKIIRNVKNLVHNQECIATIGNFDGVHLGHQAILNNVIVQSKSLSLPSTVIIFEPQPQEFFLQHQAPARLTSLREKIAFFQTLGIEQVVILKFNSLCVTMSAEDFIQRILVNSLKVKFLFVGDDFRFGNKATGDFDLLNSSGAKYGFVVQNTNSLHVLGERISSTKIRNTLQQNDFVTAETLLGRPYRLCGKVRHGAKRGRLLGFPTANLSMRRKISPVNGVYKVKIIDAHNQIWNGIANIGSRPTVTGNKQVILEAHIFDFNADIYHQYISVEPVQKIRDEKRFASIEELRQQIIKDVAYARTL